MKVNNTNIFSAVELLINQVNEVLVLVKENNSKTVQIEAPASANDPIDVEEVCRLTKKARSTIYRNCNQGTLPSYKKGGKLYFFKSEVLEWLKSERKKSDTDYYAEAEMIYKRRA